VKFTQRDSTSLSQHILFICAATVRDKLNISFVFETDKKYEAYDLWSFHARFHFWTFLVLRPQLIATIVDSLELVLVPHHTSGKTTTLSFFVRARPPVEIVCSYSLFFMTHQARNNFFYLILFGCVAFRFVCFLFFFLFLLFL
jgi:hypothetical protein